MILPLTPFDEKVCSASLTASPWNLIHRQWINSDHWVGAQSFTSCLPNANDLKVLMHWLLYYSLVPYGESCKLHLKKLMIRRIGASSLAWGRGAKPLNYGNNQRLESTAWNTTWLPGPSIFPLWKPECRVCRHRCSLRIFSQKQNRYAELAWISFISRGLQQ